jgi:hypothetical protein
MNKGEKVYYNRFLTDSKEVVIYDGFQSKKNPESVRVQFTEGNRKGQFGFVGKQRLTVIK